MSISSFFQQYFIDPVYLDTGYNFYNTLTYAVIAIVAVYLIYLGFSKLNINFDLKFFIAALPFIILGSSLRAFVDHNIYPLSFWNTAPGIYLAIAGIFLPTAIISHSFLKEKYWKHCLLIGSVIVIAMYFRNWKALGLENIYGGLAIAGLALIITAAIYFIFKYSKKEWCKDNIVMLPIAGHVLDASATFIFVDFFSGIEKHPLPKLFSEFTGTAATFIALKLAVLLPLIYLIKTEIKEKNLQNYLLIVIAILGLSEGLRDLITLVLV